MANERRWLTVAEVAALLSIHPKTVSAWCLTHRLPAVRIGGRGPWRIDWRKVEEVLERQIQDNGPARALGIEDARGSHLPFITKEDRERAR